MVFQLYSSKYKVEWFVKDSISMHIAHPHPPFNFPQVADKLSHYLCIYLFDKYLSSV